jgi:hypothetical protein
MSERPFGFKGDRLSKEALNAIVRPKLEDMEETLRLLEGGTPLVHNPRKHEVEFAIGLYKKLLGKKEVDEEAIVRGFASLPTLVCKTQTLETNLMVHLGVAYKFREIGDKIVPIYGVRSKFVVKATWIDILDFVKESVPEEVKKSGKIMDWIMLEHDVNEKHMARVTCPGWGKLVNGKVTAFHECGHDRAVREPWHKMLCDSCAKSLKKARGTFRSNPAMEAIDMDAILNDILG